MKRRTFTARRGARLSELIAEALPVPAAAARELVERGATYVNGRRAGQDGPVPAGARLTVVEEAVAPPAEDAPDVEVLHEDGELLVVNKPAGVPTQATPGQVRFTMEAAAARYLGRPAGLVHRLDRETSGVLAFGKSPAATSALARAFRDQEVAKRYLAITPASVPDRGEIDRPLSRDPRRPGRWRTAEHGQGLAAFTSFEVLGRTGGHALVELAPRTGRTHQLRAHLASIGAPIVGDRLYGGLAGPRCLLHARSLAIVGRVIEAPVPADFRPFLAGVDG